jgi:UDP-3-O-[3-hydroxymyristoyl] glucosamine N-acyltransferase
MRLRELAHQLGAELVGDGDVVVSRVASLDNAQASSITFLSNVRQRSALAATGASAVILERTDAALTELPKLIVDNAYAAYARAARLLHPPAAVVPGVHASAVVASSATVAASAAIGPFVTIGERSTIGARASIGAGAVVGDDCVVGDDTIMHPRVALYARTSIGKRTIIHSGAVIGADGFGMAEHEGQWVKIPQIGGVRIGDDVEVGANTTIDRGALDDTVIEDDVKLDNQIQIGHNCRIGAHTAIAGCTGIAGSTVIGRNCKIGGASMIVGHIELADDVVISGATVVTHTIRTAGLYTSVFPILPNGEWRHAAAAIRRLASVVDRVRALEQASRHHKGE